MLTSLILQFFLTQESNRIHSNLVPVQIHHSYYQTYMFGFTVILIRFETFSSAKFAQHSLVLH